MALGTGHIKKLFEEKQSAPDLTELQSIATRLRHEAPRNAAALALLEALEADFPELKETPRLKKAA
jgi:hypothetical protein